MQLWGIGAEIHMPIPICPPSVLYDLSLSTDYGALTTLLIFDSCETQQCTDIIIINDTVNDTRLGNSNSFFVNLQRTPDLDPRIKLDPLVAKIEITNNNGL